MLKHEITYEDFDGDKVTETLYFNLSNSELIEMDVEHEEGMHNWLQKMVKIEDKKQLFAEFKKLLLASYGEKSPDGKRFVKSEQIRNDFLHSAAYEALFFELMTDEETVANFIKGILPKELQEEAEKAKAVAKEEAQKKTDSPPTPST